MKNGSLLLNGIWDINNTDADCSCSLRMNRLIMEYPAAINIYARNQLRLHAC